jgi:hypothetical protein
MSDGHLVDEIMRRFDNTRSLTQRSQATGCCSLPIFLVGFPSVVGPRLGHHCRKSSLRVSIWPDVGIFRRIVPVDSIKLGVSTKPDVSTNPGVSISEASSVLGANSATQNFHSRNGLIVGRNLAP